MSRSKPRKHREDRRHARADREFGEGIPRSINPAKLFRPSQVRAKSPGQQAYLDAIDECDVVFGLGPAGSGKTYLAVAKAVEALQAGDCRKVVLVRPTVGVGRTMGFLPGDLESKVSPYLRPVLDEMGAFYAPGQLKELVARGEIELTSLEYMRGRTLKHAVVILDEAQNATFADMKVFLTRLGEGSKYVVTGDTTRGEDGRLEQSDLHPAEQGALEYYADRFADLPGVAAVAMTRADSVRHPLVKLFLERGL